MLVRDRSLSPIDMPNAASAIVTQGLRKVYERYPTETAESSGMLLWLRPLGFLVPHTYALGAIRLILIDGRGLGVVG